MESHRYFLQLLAAVVVAVDQPARVLVAMAVQQAAAHIVETVARVLVVKETMAAAKRVLVRNMLDQVAAVKPQQVQTRVEQTQDQVAETAALDQHHRSRDHQLITQVAAVAQPTAAVQVIQAQVKVVLAAVETVQPITMAAKIVMRVLERLTLAAAVALVQTSLG
jgi:hypothetical protein